MNACFLLLTGITLLFSCRQKPDISTVENSETISVTQLVEDSLPATEQKSGLAMSMEAQGLVDIRSLDASILVDLKYATTDNFTKTVLYDSLTQAYLHPVAADKLAKAHRLLKEIHPDYSLLVYDAARPISVQRKMYDVVQNTKYKIYVAHPGRTGLHNYGMAVDITICDGAGVPLDMGTPFDYFGKAAGINQEEQLKTEGILSRAQIDNRKLLRKVMTGAGFVTVRGEWWHFNAMSLAQAKQTSKLIE